MPLRQTTCILVRIYFARSLTNKSEFTSRLTYPDPLKPSGIEFDLPEDSRVTLVLFDPQGHELAKVIEDQLLTAGTHSIDFVAHGFSQGAYLCRLSVAFGGKQFIDTKRIVVG